MKDIIRAFRRIPERNRTIAYGIMSLLKNLCFFAFKIIVGIIYRTPLLIAVAIYNLLIGFVKANCSRGLLKNKDDYKDSKTYIIGGGILFLSSIFYIIYTANQVNNPVNRNFNLVIAILIATFAAYRVGMSVGGLIRIKGKTMLIKEYKITNFAIALTNVVLTQIAILSYLEIENMHYYNSIFGGIVGCIILICGLYLVIHGLIHIRVYTSGVTNAKVKENKNKIENAKEKEQSLN